MNIFVLDDDPVHAASALCDKHIVSQSKEYLQILSTVQWVLGARLTPSEMGHLFKMTHKNHPCVLWACESEGNYRWLYRLALATLREYHFRFKREHASYPMIHLLERAPRMVNQRLGVPRAVVPITYFAPLLATWREVVDIYREYYIVEKSRFAQWTHGTPPPNWYVEPCANYLVVNKPVWPVTKSSGVIVSFPA